jgi:hypothetical protein
MMRHTLAYFLMILLAFATLDDVIAAATPDPSDDVIAAEHDEYLPSVCRPAQKATGESDAPPPAFLNTPDGGSCAAPAPGGPAISPVSPPTGPSPLYVFMSLRC